MALSNSADTPEPGKPLETPPSPLPGQPDDTPRPNTHEVEA